MGRMYCGLDLEMTGTDVWEHRLIQVGISFDPRDETKNFVSDVGWAKGNYEYQEEALQVIRWDFSRIESGPSFIIVGDRIASFFEEMGAQKGKVIPCGFAVGSFDMPFMAQTFPWIMEYFVKPQKAPIYSYRVVDLSQVAMAFGWNHSKNEWGYKAWKKASKEYAESELEEIGINPQWHDAGYDAKAAILAMEFFTLQIKERN